MNPSRYIHSVTGERLPATASGGTRTRVYAPVNSGEAMSVLVEGLTSKQKAALINIKWPCYRMTWGGGTDIKEGDRITYSGHAYILEAVTDDTTRPTGPYQTGILNRKPLDS